MQNRRNGERHAENCEVTVRSSQQGSRRLMKLSLLSDTNFAILKDKLFSTTSCHTFKLSNLGNFLTQVKKKNQAMSRNEGALCYLLYKSNAEVIGSKLYMHEAVIFQTALTFCQSHEQQHKCVFLFKYGKSLQKAFQTLDCQEILTRNGTLNCMTLLCSKQPTDQR